MHEYQLKFGAMQQAYRALRAKVKLQMPGESVVISEQVELSKRHHGEHRSDGELV